MPVLLIFWGIGNDDLRDPGICLQADWRRRGLERLDPAKLPPLTHPKKQKSLAARIADLVVHCLWMLYVLAIPQHPYLILGPGALFMTMLSAGFGPVWRPFYVAILFLLLAQLAIKLMALTPWQRSMGGATWVTNQGSWIGARGAAGVQQGVFRPHQLGSESSRSGTGQLLD